MFVFLVLGCSLSQNPLSLLHREDCTTASNVVDFVHCLVSSHRIFVRLCSVPPIPWKDDTLSRFCICIRPVGMQLTLHQKCYSRAYGRRLCWFLGYCEYKCLVFLWRIRLLFHTLQTEAMRTLCCETASIYYLDTVLIGSFVCGLALVTAMLGQEDFVRSKDNSRLYALCLLLPLWQTCYASCHWRYLYTCLCRRSCPVSYTHLTLPTICSV